MTQPRKIIPIAVAAAGADSSLLQVEAAHKIYARAVSGGFAKWRWVMVWLTQLFFYGVPWLQWNGRQAVLFDLEERRFFLFNLALYPQDLIYLAALLILSAMALFFATAVAGRVWCGFACPQTVYTQIFMWVERRVEGDRTARMRLDAAPWSLQKFARKGGKQGLWVAISLWTGFTFVGYFTPILTLAASSAAWTAGPYEVFWVLFYGLATYGNAGYLREQVCKHMCPYARFQGAMFDSDTLTIHYDSARGESRGSRPRSADPKALGLGDCIACTLCVQVCPTGIDIRNGVQSNCIGCTACIDACDSVMDKMFQSTPKRSLSEIGKSLPLPQRNFIPLKEEVSNRSSFLMNHPRGLIRYTSENGLAQGWDRAALLKRIVRPRVLIYGAILLAVAGSLAAGLALRSPLRVDVIRDRGVMARVVGHGEVENVYRLQIMNTTEAVQRYRIDVQGLQGLAMAQDIEIELAPVQERLLPVTVRLPADAAASLAGQKLPIAFRITQLAASGQGAQVLENSTFLVPR